MFMNVQRNSGDHEKKNNSTQKTRKMYQKFFHNEQNYESFLKTREKVVWKNMIMRVRNNIPKILLKNFRHLFHHHDII